MYEQKGYADHAAYIDALCEQAGEDADIVRELADLLGPSEDFDGLLTTLKDYGIDVTP